MSQNFETYYSTLSNMRAYGQKCYNSFDYFIYSSLSSQYISLSVCNIALSLSSLLPISFSLSFFFFSHSLPLSAFWYYRCRFDPSLHLYLSLFFFLSLSLSLSFPVTKKKAIPIWSKARRLKLANLNLCSPIWSSTCPRAVAGLCSLSSTVADLCSLSSTVTDLCSSSSTALAADGWLSLVIDWFVGLGFCWRFWVFLFFYFFYFLFCWGFWIWNLLGDSVIVVVVCGGGCSGVCWFLGGGDYHWLCICIFARFWINILF